MLEGIEILNQTEIMGSSTWNTVLIIFGSMLAFTGLMTMILYNDQLGTFLSGIFLFVIGFFSISIGYIIKTEPTGIYEYQVTIDESVLATDLYENYEVIKQDGKIWTIMEKNHE